MARGRGSRSGVKIIGGEELQEKLKALGVRATYINALATQTGADLAVAEANMRAPEPGIVEWEKGEESKPMREVAALGVKQEKWYYIFWETGADPHEIPGGNKKKKTKLKKQAMKFPMGGEDVFAKHVHHPGIPAQPFLRPALSRRQQIVDAMGKVWWKEIEKLLEKK